MKKSRLIVLGIICLLIGSVYFFQMRISRQVVLSDAEIKKYDIYKLAITENTTKDDIKELCDEIGKERAGDIEYIKLSSDELKDYLYEFKEIEENDEIGDKIYIIYITDENLKVSLIYGNEGITQMGIYDETKDTFVSISQEGGTLYKNFSQAFREDTRSKED
ncbi:MAG: hypothetical protein AB7E42_08355 [Anaerotignaceae bacterium]